MSTDPGSDVPAPDDGGAPQRVRTGIEGVDEVLRAVEELEERPIEEHVGVFETAHTRLRHALDHPDESPADESQADESPADETQADPAETP